MTESIVFSRDSEVVLSDKYHLMKIKNFLETFTDCLRQHLEKSIDGDKVDILDILPKCVKELNTRSVLIFSGDQDICKYRGVVLVVPELTGESILKVLTVASSCSDRGNPLGTLVFLLKGSAKKYEESLLHAWELLSQFGVSSLRVLKLKKRTTTRWTLG